MDSKASATEGQDLNIWENTKVLRQDPQSTETVTAEANCFPCQLLSEGARFWGCTDPKGFKCFRHRDETPAYEDPQNGLSCQAEISSPSSISPGAEALTANPEWRAPCFLTCVFLDDEVIADDGYMQCRKDHAIRRSWSVDRWIRQPRRTFADIIVDELCSVPKGCETILEIYQKAYGEVCWGCYGPARRKLVEILDSLPSLESPTLEDTIELGGQTGNPWGNESTRKTSYVTRKRWGFKKTAVAAAICLGVTMVPLAAAQHHVPEAILHTAIGTSVTASLAVPIIRNIGDGVSLGWLITTYSIWVAGFIAHLVCELLRRPNSLQRRLLGGAVLLLALKLHTTLAQSASSTLESILSWGPLDLTASLCVVAVLMDLFDIGELARMLATLAGLPAGGDDNNA